jgi:DNA-binding response OmpR family regulator
LDISAEHFPSDGLHTPDVKLLDDQAGWIAVEQGQTPPTILLVEDDQSIQSMVEEALTEGGFEVTIFASGEEAVAALNHKTFRAVVSDIHLSGKLDGWDVARMARESNPALPIIYMTGAAAEEWASKGVPNSVLLTKPFAPAQLVTAVSQLLNAGTPTGNAP